MDETKELFERYNTTAYEVLGVNKEHTKEELKVIYKKRARLLHPDKNFGKDTTLEFQLLTLAYEYIKHEIKTNPKSFVELKQAFNSNEEQILHNNEIVRLSAPKSGYTNQRETETDYSKIAVETPEQLMKRFNPDKFNAIFEHFSKQNESKELVKTVSGYTKDSRGCRVITDGVSMIVAEEDFLNDYTLEDGTDYHKGFIGIKQPKKKEITKEIDYSRSEVKEGIRKLKSTEIKSLVNEKFSETPQVNNKKTFVQAQADFVNNQLESMRSEHQKNKSYIKKNSHLFPKGYLE